MKEYEISHYQNTTNMNWKPLFAIRNKNTRKHNYWFSTCASNRIH